MNSDSPCNIIVLGMAGAGKTTFVNKLTEYLKSQDLSCYNVNLDPAVLHVPYACNIDIRDTIKFKEVMKQYGFGPNGAIMTSLNMFTSQFHTLIDILKKNEGQHKNIIFDTPGQIEVFTWSASGIIITEALANLFPTVILYVIDTPRCHSPTTFMSNMLYACSITYRMRLPLVCVFNKTDVIDCKFALEWMKDFEKFQESLSAQRGHIYGVDPPEMDDTPTASITSPYLTGLTNSLSLVLDDFYSEIKACGVSSLDGRGFDHLLVQLREAQQEFIENFLPEMEKKRKKMLTDKEKLSPGTLLDVKDDQLDEDDDEETWEVGSQKSLRKFVAKKIQKQVSDAPGKSKPMLLDLCGTADQSEDAIADMDDGVEQKPYELYDEDELGVNFQKNLKVEENS